MAEKGSKKTKFNLEQTVQFPDPLYDYKISKKKRIGIIKQIFITNTMRVSICGGSTTYNTERKIEYGVVWNPSGNLMNYPEEALQPLDTKHRLTWNPEEGEIILVDKEKYVVKNTEIVRKKNKEEAIYRSVAGAPPDFIEEYWIKVRKIDKNDKYNPQEELISLKQEKPFEVVGRM